MAGLCHICKTRPARIHCTEIVNNRHVSVELCVECARERGIEIDAAGAYALGDLVAGLIDTAAADTTGPIGRVRCPGCGYDYSDFKNIGRFGCPECYAAFAAQLMPVLRQVHGNTRHTGKVPPDRAQAVATAERIRELREALDRAVSAEEYEKAASIRDEIRALDAGEGDGA